MWVLGIKPESLKGLLGLLVTGPSFQLLVFLNAGWETKFYCYKNGAVVPTLDRGRMSRDSFVKYNSGAWEMAQRVKVLAVQMWGPEFRFSEPM